MIWPMLLEGSRGHFGTVVSRDTPKIELPTWNTCRPAYSWLSLVIVSNENGVRDVLSEDSILGILDRENDPIQQLGRRTNMENH